MVTCNRSINRLLMMRTRGLCAPFMQRVGVNTCARSKGNVLASRPTFVASAELLDEYTVRVYFNHCVEFVTGVPLCGQAPTHGIIHRTNASPVVHANEVVLPTIKALQYDLLSPVLSGDTVTFEYVDTNGCIVDCFHGDPIPAQAEFTIPNPL